VVQVVVLRFKGTKKSKKQQIITIVTFKMASFGIYIAFLDFFEKLGKKYFDTFVKLFEKWTL
jgi:hypothetical protein